MRSVHLPVAGIVDVKDRVQDIDAGSVEHAAVLKIALWLGRRKALAISGAIGLVYPVPGLSPYGQFV